MNDESRREWEPDRRAIAVENLQRRIRAICEARINREWPLGRRLEVVAAALVRRDQTLPSDVRRYVENDASALNSLVRFTTSQRLAADALCELVARSGADLTKINPADDCWWSLKRHDDQDPEAED